MKHSLRFLPQRPFLSLLLLCSLFVLLTGCVDKKLFWAPDGSRALLLTKEELLLCDAQGKVIETKVPKVINAAWCPDAATAVLVLEKKTDDWAFYATLLSPERVKEIAELGEATRANLGKGNHDLAPRKMKDGGIYQCALLYLSKKLSSEELKKLKPEDRQAIDACAMEYYETVVAQVFNDRVELGRTLGKYAGELVDLRVSPDGKRLLLSEMESHQKNPLCRLLLSSLDGAQTLVVVEAQTNLYPDWSLDGGSIWYCHTQVPNPDAGDQAQLGTLCRQALSKNEKGGVYLREAPVECAVVLYDPFMRVRCLPDGRVLFSATEMKLPSSRAEIRELPQHLYAVDPARQATLTNLIPYPEERKLSASVNAFEPSPDGKQVLFAGNDGLVCLLDIASGTVQEVQTARGGAPSIMPAWRAAGEFSYFKNTSRAKAAASDKEADARAFELVLRKEGKDRVLSREWTDDRINSVR